jgi:LmbE family N-acetylglucosaminyl deacetylase
MTNETIVGDSFLKGKTVLVIAPHPDDEVLGCGGLMARAKKDDCNVYVLFVCVGDAPQYGGESKVAHREEEIDQAMDYLKVDGYHLAYKDNDHHLNLDQVPRKKLIDLIEKDSPVSLHKIKPDIVMLPFQYSYHQDHQAVFQAGYAAVRPRPSETKLTPSTILSYEQPDLYWPFKRFLPNVFVDITDELDQKISALQFHKTQIRPFPNPVSLETVKYMARIRGVSIGVKAAEAYQCLRIKLC